MESVWFFWFFSLSRLFSLFSLFSLFGFVEFSVSLTEVANEIGVYFTDFVGLTINPVKVLLRGLGETIRFLRLAEAIL